MPAYPDSRQASSQQSKKERTGGKATNVQCTRSTNILSVDSSKDVPSLSTYKRYQAPSRQPLAASLHPNPSTHPPWTKLNPATIRPIQRCKRLKSAYDQAVR